MKAPTRAGLARSQVLVMGMCRAGTAMARFLLKLGARVWGWDDAPQALDAQTVKRLRAAGMTVPRRAEQVRVDFAVVSPGVPNSNPVVRGLWARRVPIVDELDLASRYVNGELIAVTGTNGKSTTAALIAEMLRQDGRRVFVGGNLAPGRPLSAALGVGRARVHVVEVSSFQLERARWLAPRVAVVLNVTPDHLNRHRTIERYADCKFRVLDRQGPDDFAVLNREDPVVMTAGTRGRAQRRLFSVRRRVDGAFLMGKHLYFREELVASERRMALPGRHNVENALAAMAAVLSLGVDPAAVRRALRAFQGLPHRLELVRRIAGVPWYNNSMCTNPTAGVRSLEVFPTRKVVLITGGREKGLPVRDYVKAVARRARWAVLLGESADLLARMLRQEGCPRFEVCGNLRTAVHAARCRARAGDTVLFSPAFASFDQFRDFQERGRAFRKEVRGLR